MIIKSVFSPTWLMAKCLKSNKTKDERSKLIKNLNIVFLVVSIVSLIGVVAIQYDCRLTEGCSVSSLIDTTPFWYKAIWFYFLFSRCTEIFIAFLADASDKLKNNSNMSSLEFFERLRLALSSYIELIINFAFIYMLTPSSYWGGNNLASVTDALFYSAATITTLSDSSVSPCFWFVQFLTIYQVFCGFSLLIVCFTVYTSKAINNDNATHE